MGEYLAVGLRAEDVPRSLEPRAQLGGVLDDAVVDDGESAGAVRMRMGVHVARLAVRRPARVSDPDAAVQALREVALELGDLASRLVQLEPAARHDRDPGRIVAAVLEAMQPGEQDGDGVLAPDVADDATHARTPFSAVDQPADLTLAERRRGKASRPHLGRDTLEDRVVLQLLGAQLAVAAGDVLLDRFRVVRHHLLDQAGGGAFGEPRDLGQVPQEVVGAPLHDAARIGDPAAARQDICPNPGRNRPKLPRSPEIPPGVAGCPRAYAG